MSITLFIAVTLLNIPLYLLLGKSFFGSWGGFVRSTVAIFTPEEMSAISGDYHEHRIGRFTLILFLIVCAVTTAAEYHLVAKHLFGMEYPWG